MAKKNAGAIPAGYTVFGGSSDGAKWEPHPGAILMGKCVGKKTIDAKTAGRQNAKKGETVTIVSVADGDSGEVFAIWESHAIAEWCKRVKNGDAVFLKFNGLKKSGKKRFKDITAGIKGK